MTRLFSIILVVFASGCVSQPYLKSDPNEKQVIGEVIYKAPGVKKDIDKELADINTSRAIGALGISAMLTAANAGIVVIPRFDDAVQGNPTSYGVKLKTGQTLKLYSHYSGFEVGDCVLVFLSERWQKYPPRMTSASGAC